jgi:fructose 1,6-bisphosphate aldolase/phosphatase
MGGWSVHSISLMTQPLMRLAASVTPLLTIYLRSHDPFEPYRLPMDGMDYTTLPQVMAKLEGRWQ